MLKVGRKFWSTLLVCATALSMLGLNPPLGRTISLTTYKTHSRLTFAIDGGTDYELKHTGEGFELVLKGVRLVDLGASFGHEDEFAKQFSDIRDDRLTTLRLSEGEAGVTVAGKWKFPSGDSAPAVPKMEYFEFREKAPAKLNLDFWLARGETVAEVRAKQIQAKKLAAIKKAEKKQALRAKREVATVTRRKLAGDVTEFCKYPLSDENDVFLPFRPVHKEVEFGQWFSLLTPDDDYPYLEPKGEEKDAQYVRLALKLYRQGQPALAIRTIDFLDSEYSKSPYKTEMRFLRANALIKLGYQAQAIEIFKVLTLEAKGSPSALHAGIYIAGNSFGKKSYLESLEQFLWLTHHYPNHRLNWVFHLGAAESMYKLRQTDRAAKEYQWIAENGPTADARAEAGLRSGDIYLERRNYEQALAAYFQALKVFGKEAEKRVAVYLNRAEALYWLRQYDRAEKAYVWILEKYAQEPDVWRASYRLAEIQGRKNGDKNREIYRSLLLSTINRYPFTPGATLARLRMLPCGDHAGFDAISMKQFFETETQKFDAHEEVVSARYKDLVTLTQYRALIGLGQYADAMDSAIDGLRSNISQQGKEMIRASLRLLFRTYALKLLADGKAYDALAAYQKYEWALPIEGDPVSSDYLLKLSEAATQLSMGDVSKKLLDTYRRSIGQEMDSEGRKVATSERLDVDDRIRTSDEAVTEAKALWIKDGAAAETRIRSLVEKISEESALYYQRELLLATLDELNGALESSIQHATKAELLVPQTFRQSKSRIRNRIAKNLEKAGKPDLAIGFYKTIEEAPAVDGEGSFVSFLDDLRYGSAPTTRESKLAIAEILEKQSKWGEAADLYGELATAQNEDHRVAYSMARALLKTGDTAKMEKALATFERLSGEKTQDFWTDMARRTLEAERMKSQ